MPQGMVLEELHLTVSAPQGWPQQEYDATYQALNDTGFLTELRRAVRRVFRRHPPLDRVQVKLSK